MAEKDDVYKVFDEVLGEEKIVQRKIGPKIGKEIKLEEIEPQIPIEEALKSMEENGYV